MVTRKIIINAHRHSAFDSKFCNVILQTEQNDNYIRTVG